MARNFSLVEKVAQGLLTYHRVQSAKEKQSKPELLSTYRPNLTRVKHALKIRAVVCSQIVSFSHIPRKSALVDYSHKMGYYGHVDSARYALIY